MPGIVTVISKKRGTPAGEIAKDVSGVLYRRESYRQESVDSEGFSLRLLYGRKDSRGLIDNPAFTCTWWGRPLLNDRILTVSDLENRDFNPDDPAGFLTELQGHFQLVFHSKSRQQTVVFADKISTHPHYYTETDDFIAVSPEAMSLLALKKYGWNSTLREGALQEFIANGFLWGDGTYLNEIERLSSGTFVTCSREGTAKTRYWQMTFSRRSAGKLELMEGLNKTVETDIKHLPPGKAILTLSGGYDSRALLGLMKKNGRMFDSISYTFGLPYSDDSDAGVGRYFAHKSGIVHHFHQADLRTAETVIDNLQGCITASGGESDAACSQDALLGAGFYSGLLDNFDYLVRGDELWGWEDHAVSRRMAFYEATLLNLNENPQPMKLLTKESFRQGIDYIKQQRIKYGAEFERPFGDFNSLKDTLYWRHKQSRLMGNMAYYRRCHLPHYAPFLFDNVINYMITVGSRHRINKNLFMDTMKKEYPGLFLDPNIPYSHGPKITKYELLYQSRTFTGFLKKILTAEAPQSFLNIFDESKFVPWVETTLAPKPRLTMDDFRQNVQTSPLRAAAARMIRKNRFLLGYTKSLLVKKGTVEMPYWQRDTSHIFRLAVMALALKRIEDSSM